VRAKLGRPPAQTALHAESLSLEPAALIRISRATVSTPSHHA
jgi:hypothetical protein